MKSHWSKFRLPLSELMPVARPSPLRQPPLTSDTFVQSRSLVRSPIPAETVVSTWTLRSPKTKEAAAAEVENRRAEANATATADAPNQLLREIGSFEPGVIPVDTIMFKVPPYWMDSFVVCPVTAAEWAMEGPAPREPAQVW